MKNKKFTYLLGLVVVVVWGLIIYRIFDAVSANDDNSAPVVPNTIKKEPFNDFAVPVDTTHLLLNYRDPFGLVKQKDTISQAAKIRPVKSIASLPVKPTFNWGFIQYSGYILNPASKKLTTLITINGKNEMLSEGEMKDQVKLIKNLRDSIKISFNGKTKFITIRKAVQ